MNKPKATPGPYKEVIEAPTPHGGAFTVTYFFDSHYKPVVKEQATRAIIHEYDEKSRSIFREYLTLEKGQPILRKNPSAPPAKDLEKKTDDTPIMDEVDLFLAEDNDSQ